MHSASVCIFGGAFFGTMAWLLAMAAFENDVRPLAYLLKLPILMIYALPIAIPFGAVAAIVAMILFKILLNSKWQALTRQAWLFTGGGAGLLLGGMFPFFLSIIGFRVEQPNGIWVCVRIVAGTLCGFGVGWLGWREVRRKTVSW
jgi:hypothetical protein